MTELPQGTRTAGPRAAHAHPRTPAGYTDGHTAGGRVAGRRRRTPALASACALTVTAMTGLTGCGTAAGHTMAASAFVHPRAASSTTRDARCERPSRPIPTKLSEWGTVEHTMGRIGFMTNGDVFRIPLPRRDLKVTSEGVPIITSLALSGDAAFARYCDGTMLMGDMVLTQRELPKVTAALQAAGIAQTAIHKHLADTSPDVWWTHFQAMGDPVTLAEGLRSAVAQTTTPVVDPNLVPPTRLAELNPPAIDAALGRAGTPEGMTIKYFIPHSGTIVEKGHVLPPEIGVSTVIKFQTLGGRRAAINGDILATASEVQRVLRALTRHGIYPVAVHNHMLNEHPRMFFIHYWATGDGTALALALRHALDQTHLAPPSAADRAAVARGRAALNAFRESGGRS